jgi:hypothetical protein
MSESYWGYITAAYTIAALAIGGMTVKILLEYRSLKQGLGKLAGTNTRRDDIP